MQYTGQSGELSLPFLEGGLQTKLLSPRLSDGNMKHPGGEAALALAVLMESYEALFSERQLAVLWAKQGEEEGGVANRQGKQLSQAFKIPCGDCKIHLLTCRAAPSNDNCQAPSLENQKDWRVYLWNI